MPITEAMRHQPGFRQSQYHLGLAMLEMGRAQLAVPQFEAVLRGSHNHADARFQMGRALSEIGESDAALPTSVKPYG